MVWPLTGAESYVGEPGKSMKAVELAVAQKRMVVARWLSAALSEQRCLGTKERGAFCKRSLEQPGLVDAAIFGNELNLLTSIDDSNDSMEGLTCSRERLKMRERSRSTGHLPKHGRSASRRIYTIRTAVSWRLENPHSKFP
jgi:hypothetical protein